jgi:hypothetical protein
MLRLCATNAKERFPDPEDDEDRPVGGNDCNPLWAMQQRQRGINWISMLNICNHNVVLGWWILIIEKRIVWIEMIKINTFFKLGPDSRTCHIVRIYSMLCTWEAIASWFDFALERLSLKLSMFDFWMSRHRDGLCLSASSNVLADVWSVGRRAYVLFSYLRAQRRDRVLNQPKISSSFWRELANPHKYPVSVGPVKGWKDRENGNANARPWVDGCWCRTGERTFVIVSIAFPFCDVCLWLTARLTNLVRLHSEAEASILEGRDGAHVLAGQLFIVIFDRTDYKRWFKQHPYRMCMDSTLFHILCTVDCLFLITEIWH